MINILIISGVELLATADPYSNFVTPGCAPLLYTTRSPIRTDKRVGGRAQSSPKNNYYFPLYTVIGARIFEFTVKSRVTYFVFV